MGLPQSCGWPPPSCCWGFSVSGTRGTPTADERRSRLYLQGAQEKTHSLVLFFLPCLGASVKTLSHGGGRNAPSSETQNATAFPSVL